MSNEPGKTHLPDDFIFSQSSLQDFSDCPRRFQLRYIEKLSWPAVESEPILESERLQQAGQLFHRLVQQYWLDLPREKLARLANTTDLARWWQNFIDYSFGIDDYAKYTELTLTAPLGAYRLTAKYDLIAARSGQGAIILDWKTYHKRPKDEWMASRLQTRVYRALLVQAGAHLNQGVAFQPDQIEMIYWYSEHPSQPARLPYSPAQFTRDLDYLNGMLNDITRHAHFPLTDDEKKCTYCPYRSYCNRGRTAGSQMDAAEAELSDLEINFEQIAEIEF